MHISIVTGTYNRLPHLRSMINSVRQQIPLGIAYEFVIVDGGSTDGTLNYLRSQHDVKLIEHGELRGAIRAFCDGANAASGDYVILANDDVTFLDDGVMRAFAYLETHPDCGAVAFADNRPAPGYGDGFKVQTMRGIRDGEPVDVVYAQVGMYRRWLGDLAGWWGADDPIMGQARTYGGDNYLSARIWEMGYTVDAVDGVRVADHIVSDELRRANGNADALHSAFYARYPDGAVIGAEVVKKHIETRRMRILYMPLYERGFGKYKRGLRDALSKIGVVYEWDYQNEPGSIARHVETWQPDLLFMQVHDTNTITPNALTEARRYCPQMIVVNWNGDVYLQALTAPDMLTFLKEVDMQLTVNADALPVYAENGIAAAYWQIGYEPIMEYPEVEAHDVVFLGNNYSEKRRELGDVLKALQCKVGLFGHGWGEDGSGATLYDFAASAALNRNAAIVIGDNQYIGQTGFVSNRIFETLAAGAFLLHQRVERLQELTGLVDGKHYVAWDDYDDMRAKVEHYLANPDAARKIAKTGERYVRKHHSFDARVHDLFTRILPSARREMAAESGD